MEVQDESDLETFLQWAAALGVSDSPIKKSEVPTFPPSSCLGHSLSVSHFPVAGGRGLAAVRDVMKGELVLRVPKEALMTSESLRSKDQKLSAALCKYQKLSSNQVLAVSLLNEVTKGKVTRWYPYLKQLPRSYDKLSSFGQLEIEALQMDDAIWTAERAVEKDKIDWREATALMGELNLKPQLMTFKAWLWASATISSRTMHIPWDSAGCLCPVGDFFNYAAPAEEPYHSENKPHQNVFPLHDTSPGKVQNAGKSVEEPFYAHEQRLIDAGYEEEIAAYCFYARRNYRKGDQVLLSYGTYTNLELLEHYGFLLHENPNDIAFIPLEPNMYSLCSWPKESLYIHQDGKPSFALLATIRLWATPVTYRRSVGHIAYSGHQISAENEVTVLEWIVQNCRALLGNCSTSIEEDELLLNTIHKIQDYNTSIDFGDVSRACIIEPSAFLEMNDRKLRSQVQICRKARLIHRWKLAVEWRLSYKRILCECISHCNERLENPFLNVS
ncbi:SET DOMAIN GROUP 40 [Olea europaea subsp. europaea]|uniref:SET DOMAIN GROUP 40 n=3 Tax=Olea europaea subsp. europaea TaxID=158383 RepID=A0A8S0UAM9_OLEEU|nr:SET DOMAIN GROUP 40 [Olea europaea subsp. europaea]